MARVPKFGGEGDFIDRSRKQQEHVRQLRSQIHGHAESKTFIAAGEITSGLYVPPCFIAINPDGQTPPLTTTSAGHYPIPEWKQIYAFRGVLRVGTCTVQWLLNEVQVGDDHLITATVNEHPVYLDPPQELADGDVLRPYISAASVDAVDLAGSAAMLTRTG